MHIFISYAKQDTRALTKDLAQQLERLQNITVWWDQTLRPGDSWAAQIQDEIKRCDLFIVLLSPDVNRPRTGKNRGSFVLKEIEYAQRRGKEILPVVAQAIDDIPILITGLQYIDLFPNQQRGMAEIIAYVRDMASIPDQRPTQTLQTLAETHQLNWAIIGMIGTVVLVLIIGAIVLATSGANGDKNTPTPNQTDISILVTAKFNQTTNAEATLDTEATYSVQTEVAALPSETYIDTPTETYTLTDEPSKIPMTEVPTFTNTSTETFTPSQTSSDTPTDTFTPTNIPTTEEPTSILTNTATYTDTLPSTSTDTPPSLTNTSTDTPAPTAISMNDNPSFQLAERGVGSNSEWTTYSQEFNGMEMVLVPTGCFQMGNDDGDDNEKPVHPQCIKQPYWISRYEITREEYQQCVEAEICLPVPESEVSTQNRQPINQTTWFDARTYCEWLDGRLPSELEWEYAARGPDNLLYVWGNEFVSENLVHGGNSGDIPAYIGSKKEITSWVGAYDMNGNIREWTSSLQFDYPYDPNDGREDPERTNYHRATRGAFYNGMLRTMFLNTARWHEQLNERSEIIGIRCARDYELNQSHSGENGQLDNPDLSDLQDLAENGIFNNSAWQTYSQEFNEVEMVFVPAGSFTMGMNDTNLELVINLCIEDGATCEADIYYTKETPANTQTFEIPFWLDKTEVTNAMYLQCVAEGECQPLEEIRKPPINACIDEQWDEADDDIKNCLPEFSIEDNQPAIIPYTAAYQYCEWRESRLPTEAEWEYAVRGPDNLLYPWGNKFEGNRVNHCDFNCNNIDWGVFEAEFGYLEAYTEFNDGYSNSAPVGSYPSNASWVGAFDMSGNVSEWVSTNGSDEFPYPYATDDGREVGIAERSDNDLIVRGGSFMGSSYRLLSLYRPKYLYDWFITGVRCARDYSPNDLIITD